MTPCTEFSLDDVMGITAIPIAKLDSTSPTSPVLALSKTLSYDFSSAFDGGTIVIGLQKAIKTVNGTATPVGTLIPIMRTTGKAKDDEGDSVSGRLHTVTVTCQVDDRASDVWEDLLTLERNPFHLLLAFRNNVRAFVSATKDTYTCTVERNGAKTTLTFKINNLMGIQLIA